jgi:ribulose-bisphosphate carboxylase large chain
MPYEARSRIRICYRLQCDTEAEARARARDIAYEQTVELPPDCVSTQIGGRIVGRIESIDGLGEGRWQATIGYDTETAAGGLSQLLNLLFGNISLKPPVVVSDVEWPDPYLATLPGPRAGIAGLRALCGAPPSRALVCTALKPMGLSAVELAGLAGRFARGGIDFIKDDHGLADQAPARFAERLRHCQDAVEGANQSTGGHTRYFPNVTSGPGDLLERASMAMEAGCRGVLVAPLLVGLDAVSRLAEVSGLAVLAHPALAGAYFHEDHGIAAGVLLGDLFRMAGCDGVIYPNAGTRFSFSEATCASLNDRLRKPLGVLRPAIPVCAGGIDVARVPYWIDRYGADTMFLIGGSLYRQADLEQATRQLMDQVRRQGELEGRQAP